MSKPRRHWNYRVLQFSKASETWRAIHEVHYENEKPVSYSECPAIVLGERKEDILDVLERMREAIEKPVLYESDFKRTVTASR